MATVPLAFRGLQSLHDGDQLLLGMKTQSSANRVSQEGTRSPLVLSEYSIRFGSQISS
jgi:hypothetical protein